MNSEGRYEVHLPWKESHPRLPNNEFLARRRLELTTERLRKQNLFEAYGQVFQECIREGVIEEVPDEMVSNYGHYLPHRPVIKENSTTRLRPVFDALARGKDSPSLNQCLETGPNLIELIPTTLMRFRGKTIGVISDIKKAFLQISVCPEDRDVLRFLWWSKDDPTKLQIYRHARVVFGVSSSPFLLGAVIEMHLERALEAESSVERKDMIGRLSRSLYVDNCVTSIDSEIEGQLFKDVSREIMLQGGFDLRGWEYTGAENPRRDSAVLGLIWDKIDDTLRLNCAILEDLLPARITKRAILSMSHKVFDPIGFSCPVLLCPKTLLRTIWLQEVGWDAQIESTFVE